MSKDDNYFYLSTFIYKKMKLTFVMRNKLNVKKIFMIIRLAHDDPQR